MHGYIHIDLFRKTSAVKLRSIYENCALFSVNVTSIQLF